MMDESDKLTSIDLFLKEKLVDLWFKAVNYSIVGDYRSCFGAYKSMFLMIKGYNFSSKIILEQLTDVISDYMDGFNGKPLSSKVMLEFNKRSVQFKELLDVYMSELPRAFIELDLWFKTIPSNNDLDLRLSDENFNSDVSLINNKRNELKKLSPDKIVSLMSANIVNDIYSRLRYENVL